MTAAGNKNRLKRTYPMKLRPFGQRHGGPERCFVQTTATKLHPMTDMTPSPSAFARNAPTCCRTAPRPNDGGRGGRHGHLTPHALLWHHPDRIRSLGLGGTGLHHRRYLALLGARRGPRVPIAAPAYWLLELITDLQEWAFTDLPNGLAPGMGAAASSPVRRQQPLRVNGGCCCRWSTPTSMATPTPAGPLAPHRRT